ncbi:MAG: bifunctional phosphoribosylaminoimidazolecarboxamide formyltransferase/IMP cyclohydrolase [Candidatus Cloacimonadota bacterium]|nr:bifunctional phosphoribosylaminoimidazolecarboxamide formyltransferase/IMP cyclohydrolase [Candidatus Cloacimonadota bacterium]
MKKRAIISVSDKTGVIELARELLNLDFEIISTGGTYKKLVENGVDAILVSEITKFPEIMNGRVKTLHPAIHGGILCDKNNSEHLIEIEKENIKPIDLVVVNLYPFQKTISKENVSIQEAIENIDIGGPTMIRAAAKNFESVSVIIDRNDYGKVINELKHSGNVSLETRKELAKKAFQHTAKYDSYIANYFSGICEEHLPSQMNLALPLISELRYGENPHQKAGFYAEEIIYKKLHGKKLSFNNLQDVDAAFKAIVKFQIRAKFPELSTVVILKHCNPCGIGTAGNLRDAYEKAFATDTMSPFGGIVIVNRTLDLGAALEINKIFTEIIIAPDFSAEALEQLKKKKNRRLLKYEPNQLEKLFPSKIGEDYSQTNPKSIRTCMNGVLVQDEDIGGEDEKNWKVVTNRKPTDVEMARLRFAWKTVSLIKSNGISICDQDRTIGLGMGQPSRIDSTEIALSKAKKFDLSVENCALGSDAFFPFRDTIDLIAKKGITAVIQPGGSRGDEEVIQACNEHDLTMIFTNMRHFRH